MNPKAMAFTEPYGCDTEYWLDEHWQQISSDTDIFITHGPPYGIRDQNYKGESCGSKSLLIAVAKIKPKLHVFSHIHEQSGKEIDVTWKNGTKFINCSIMNEKYQPINKPVRVIL